MLNQSDNQTAWAFQLDGVFIDYYGYGKIHIPRCNLCPDTVIRIVCDDEKVTINQCDAVKYSKHVKHYTSYQLANAHSVSVIEGHVKEVHSPGIGGLTVHENAIVEYVTNIAPERQPYLGKTYDRSGIAFYVHGLASIPIGDVHLEPGAPIEVGIGKGYVAVLQNRREKRRHAIDPIVADHLRAATVINVYATRELNGLPPTDPTNPLPFEHVGYPVTNLIELE
ncbi:hypothetical protein [Bosea beijingensis]|uniref:hypothetical protein n=1 Tax=Bosea beijingensis TaxID=3068632 RepID=UPI0027414B32|nr:hypothetical protein [Bosea sp. REN20]